VVCAYAYDPYGKEIARSGAAENPFTFQGRFGVTVEGGLHAMRSRYYDPESGRFLSRDPVEQVDPQGINPYAAFAGNPLFYVDPRGTTPETAASIAERHVQREDGDVIDGLIRFLETRDKMGADDRRREAREERERMARALDRAVQRLDHQLVSKARRAWTHEAGMTTSFAAPGPEPWGSGPATGTRAPVDDQDAWRLRFETLWAALPPAPEVLANGIGGPPFPGGPGAAPAGPSSDTGSAPYAASPRNGHGGPCVSRFCCDEQAWNENLRLLGRR
jgi:RHS repeat-associated protein